MPREARLRMEGTLSVGGPVPLARGGCAGARWLERMLINQGGAEHPNPRGIWAVGEPCYAPHCAMSPSNPAARLFTDNGI